MNEVLCMKRETLFKTTELEKLKDEPLKKYSYWKTEKNNLKHIKLELIENLHKKTKKLYENNENLEIKYYLNVKKNIKKLQSINETTINLLSDPVIQEHVRNYNESLKTVQLIENQVTKAFQMKVNRYVSFLAHPEFQQALTITAYDAYEQLINPKITKESVNRGRYRYIQRSTTKTSPLSYFGKTTYLSYSQELNEQVKLNEVVKFLILIASMQNNNLDHVLQISVRPIVSKKEGTEAIYFEKIYLLKGIDWVVKQDDVLHQKELVRFMTSIQHCKTPAEVKQETLKQKQFSYEFLLNNGLIIPNFNFYNSNAQNFFEFIKYIFDEDDRKLFYPRTIKEIENNTIRENIKNYLNNFSSDYYGENFADKLKNIPIFYHDYVALDDFEVPKLEKDLTENVLNNYITANDKYHNIHHFIIDNKKHYHRKSALTVLTDINERLPVQKMEESSIKFSFLPSMKKSALLYLQFEEDETPVLNAVNVGGGGVFHRYGQHFNQDLKNRLQNYYNNLFNNSYQIFELVIDEEISNHMDVGKSIFPKLKWPEDFLELEFEIKNEEINLVLNGEPIHLIYVGTVPYHLFTGIKGQLLQFIHPWRVEVENIKKINTRKSTYLAWESVCPTDKISDTDFYYAITNYFETNALPFEFFVKKKSSFFYSRKPIWISLYSVESLKVLKHLLLKERSIEVEEIKPVLSGDFVEEFCMLVTEGEG